MVLKNLAPRAITPQTNVYGYISEITPILPGLYLSSLVAARNPATLADLGITHIVTILDFPVSFSPWTGHRLVLNLSDGTDSDLLSRLDECVDFTQGGIEGGGKVLVHCMQGLSRSVCVVVGFMIRVEGVSADAGLKTVKEKRGNIQPNEGFKKQLKEYERRVKCGEAGTGAKKGGGASDARSIWSVVGWKLGWRRHRTMT
ncbi:phosphatases II [Ceratobasidium sp. AG-I]|nr:phosphatases II [Ceratobasidium sp. AG-I]